MTVQHEELDTLLLAIRDTGSAFAATVQLHDELEAAGATVSTRADLWREAIRAQRQVQAAHLAIFESIRKQVTNDH